MIRRLKKVHPSWVAAAVGFLALIGAAGMRSTPSVLMVPIEDEFGWSRADISVALSVNILMYGLTAPFAAALMERFGVRRVVIGALTSIALGAGFAIYAISPWVLVICWGFMVGCGTGSMAFVFAATIANRWFVAKRGMVIGGLGAASAAGNLVFLPIISKVTVAHGWRSASLVAAGLAFLMIPVVFFFMKERPSAIGAIPYGADQGSWVEAPRTVGNPAKVAVVTLREVIRTKQFLYLAASFFICGLSTNGLIGGHFIPAAHDHGMGETTAAGLLALVGVFDVLGSFASGWLTDRIPAKKLLFVYYTFRGLSLLFLPSILFASVHPSTVAFAIFYGIDWVATVPPTIWLCREIFGAERGAVVFGWTFAIHMIGGSVAALAAGIMRVHFGDYVLAFYAGGALCFAAAIIVMFIDPKARPLESKP